MISVPQSTDYTKAKKQQLVCQKKILLRIKQDFQTWETRSITDWEN